MRRIAMKIWNFIVDNKDIIVPVVTSLIAATASALVSIFISNRNSKKEIKNLEKQYELNFESFTKNSVYNTKVSAIYKSLSFLDLYCSWLTIDGNKPVRNKTTTLELTQIGRECYNELCTTCDSEELVLLFGNILFKGEGYTLDNLNNYRNAARKELGLPCLNFDEDICFIQQISTKDLALYEKTCQQ